ncbi:MAG: rRNA maturation RNase YbeY [Alteromonadaceae bacterium]
MTIELDLQRIANAENLPSDEQFQQWVNSALENIKTDAELTIRLVDIKESQQLNNQYCGKDKPTNVLSFPFEVPEGIELNLLGDIVICIEVVAQEALSQNKDYHSHWAHMVTHGCLHLLGYDHISDIDAVEMESLEIKILAKLGFVNPYN